MRHRFDLRMQHGMVDEAGDAQIGRGSNKAFGKNDFVRANVRTDVIDRIRPSHRPGKRKRIVHLARDDLANTHRRERRFMRKTSDEGTHRCTTCDERLDNSHARFAACAGDQDHARHLMWR
jgi:hypothetical protein